MTKDLQISLDENINIDWETSQKDVPEGKLLFLTPDQISKNSLFIGFPKKAISYLKSTVKYISNNGNFDRSNVSLWSDMTDIIGNMSGSLYLLIVLFLTRSD